MLHGRARWTMVIKRPRNVRILAAIHVDTSRNADQLPIRHSSNLKALRRLKLRKVVEPLWIASLRSAIFLEKCLIRRLAYWFDPQPRRSGTDRVSVATIKGFLGNIEVAATRRGGALASAKLLERAGRLAPQCARLFAARCLRRTQRSRNATGRGAARRRGVRAPPRCTTEPTRLK